MPNKPPVNNSELLDATSDDYVHSSAADCVTLEKLAEDIGINERTLRRYMDDPVNPLPTHHVCIGGKDRGRVLVSRAEFNEWAKRFPAARSKVKPAKADHDARQWIRKLAKG